MVAGEGMLSNKAVEFGIALMEGQCSSVCTQCLCVVRCVPVPVSLCSSLSLSLSLSLFLSPSLPPSLSLSLSLSLCLSRRVCVCVCVCVCSPVYCRKAPSLHDNAPIVFGGLMSRGAAQCSVCLQGCNGLGAPCIVCVCVSGSSVIQSPRKRLLSGRTYAPPPPLHHRCALFRQASGGCCCLPSPACNFLSPSGNWQ